MWKNSDIFTGNLSKQVVAFQSIDEHDISVYDCHTAVDAIQGIIEQGEGSDPCNPLACNKNEMKDLSHYFLFKSVVEGRGIQVVKESAGTTIDTANVSHRIDKPKVSHRNQKANRGMRKVIDWPNLICVLSYTAL